MVKTYKMRKFDAEKLGAVKKIKIGLDDDKSENAVENIMRNINNMSKKHKGKKFEFDL